MLTNSKQQLLEYFPADYFSARERFNRLTGKRGGQCTAYRIGTRGPGREALSIDSAYFGAASPQRLLIVTSGIHGVEGFAGSALQQHIINDLIDTPGTAALGGILLVHALNPSGFAHIRRTNENNVDLNRNAVRDFPGPANPAYEPFDAVLNPRSPPGRRTCFTPGLLWRGLRTGARAARQAIAGGQYRFAQGLFYGGARTEDSISILERILQAQACDPTMQVVHIDLHTGLGKFGDCKLFVQSATGSPALQSLQEWCGDRVIATADSARSGSYSASGLIGSLTRRVFANARAITATLEFGTYPLLRVLSVLRKENQLFHYGCADATLSEKIRADFLETFCPHDARWRLALLEHGGRVFQQITNGLFAT